MSFNLKEIRKALILSQGNVFNAAAELLAGPKRQSGDKDINDLPEIESRSTDYSSSESQPWIFWEDMYNRTPSPEPEDSHLQFARYWWDPVKLRGVIPSPNEGRLMRNGGIYRVVDTVNNNAVLLVPENQGEVQTTVIVPLDRLTFL